MKKVIALLLVLVLALSLSACGKKDSQAESIVEKESKELKPTLSDKYIKFGEKIQEYEIKYGKAKFENKEQNFPFMSGLCFIKLVDFLNNGEEDLLLVYLQNSKTVLEDYYAQYKFEIWGFKKDKFTLLDSGELFGSDGGETHVILTEYEGKRYLVTGGADSFGKYEYHSYSEDKFGVVRKVEWSDMSTGKGFINGNSVSYEVIRKEQDSWLENEVTFSFMYDNDAIFKQNEETKKKLSPYYKEPEDKDISETIMTSQEIYQKLTEYYKNGTEDSPGEELYVDEGVIDENNQYSTSVRCGVPGNPSASQRLYDVVVDAVTGDVIQTRVLVDNKIEQFNLKKD